MTTTATPLSQPPTIARALDLAALLERKSCFLLGPRQTGKSFLISLALGGVAIYDLLDTATFLALSQDPGRLGEGILSRDSLVVIDEIQRLPALLNEVHRLIEQRRARFLLTGSSARKLRRGGVNLLGGRARIYHLHPFSSHELGSHFELNRALHNGLLPSIYFSEDPDADLAAYAGAYLHEEIVAESATRNVPAFSRFLRVAALCNASVVNFTNVANDAQVPRTTVYEYFEILRDTLLLHELPAWRESRQRKPLVSSKYYLFDIGVARKLQHRVHRPGTPEYGTAFETLLLQELVCHRDYRSNESLSFWRSASGFEVDFLIGDRIAIEAKAKRHVSAADLKGLNAIAEEKRFRHLLCVCLEPRPRRVGAITVVPYADFVAGLWSGQWS